MPHFKINLAPGENIYLGGYQFILHYILGGSSYERTKLQK
nr:MAG TPA: Flagellar protein FlbT [Bacteriophage sp.]